MAKSVLPRFCLIIPETAGGGDDADVAQGVEQALETGLVEAIFLPVAASVDPEQARNLARLATRHRAALLVVDDVDLAVEVGAGVIFTQVQADLGSVRARLGGDAIVGMVSGDSRHGGMDAAQARVDFVGLGRFGTPATTQQLESLAELVSWWDEMIEIPCVAFGADTRAAAARLLDTGADTVALLPALWATGEPAAALREICGLVRNKQMGARQPGRIGLWAAVLVLSVAVLGVRSARAGPTEDAMAAFAVGNISAAFELALAPATNGDARAALVLARLYAQGYGPGSDKMPARPWYQQAADGGLADAQLEFGLLLAQGKQRPGDAKLAAKYFEAAASQGVADAQFNLGLIYAGGEVRKRDWQQARAWLEKAAAQGHVAAIYNLGILYQDGAGVAVDARRAADLFGRAAKAGLADAQLDYAMVVFKGQGVQKDEKVAALWFRNAAEQGNVVAQNRLARLYSSGRGVERNDLEAVKWHLLARAGGLSDPRLDLLVATLSTADRRQVDAAVETFQPVPQRQNLSQELSQNSSQ